MTQEQPTQFMEQQQQGLNIPCLTQPVGNDQQLVEIPTIDLAPVVEVEHTGSEAPLTGVYSSSGFDMVGVLSRLVNRYAF
jgi:hypothetical protein